MSTATEGRDRGPSAEGSPVRHHGLPAHEVVLLLDTDLDQGLRSRGARERLERFGPNVLPTASGTSLPVRAARQFTNPLVVVLLAAAGVTAVLGEHVDSGVILAVVLVNAAVGLIQEQKAESALQGLRSMVTTSARVVRDGQGHVVPSEDLVPGDLVLLEAGDRVPADLRIVRASELRVDESALTGESVPAAKVDIALPADTAVADRANMTYAGTLVTSGGGAGVAVATGADTELGEIHRLVGAAEVLATPLTRKLTRFSKELTVAILALAALTFGVGLLRGHDAADMFTAAVALAVGAIPEGLPAAITVVMAIGVTRLARRRAVVRRLPAVETLGSTTVICSDKTGTLTENQMTVSAIWTPAGLVEVTGSGYAPEGMLRSDGVEVTPGENAALRWALVAGALCNDARLSRHEGRWSVVGDPTEGALVVAATKAGLDPRALASAYPRVATITFDAQRQFMATLHRQPEPDAGHGIVLVKGAAERVVDMCSCQLDAQGGRHPVQRAVATGAAAELAGRGLRVLATAVGDDLHPDDLTADALTDLVLTGLIAMHDPPRPAARAAVRACQTAGISVRMITGDHAATATVVAREVGLLDGSDTRVGVLGGDDLVRLSPEVFPEEVDGAAVFARVSPEQKLRLVEALQARGHIVAMTGDGVNDAPALRQADIGVAMGRGGTEVAQDAADIVLTDDDFATIEAAVEEGRGVFDNLTKFIIWTLPTNIGEGLVILVAILLGTALPILPTQILWINMTTAVALGLMLAFEPTEAGIMNRPPRDPAQPILTPVLLQRILLLSALLVGGSWWLFGWELDNGASLPEARTAALNLFVAVQAFYLVNCRSLTQSVWRLGLLSNRWIVLGMGVQALAQLVLTYAPVMHDVFGTAPLTGAAWARILAIALAASAVISVEKWVRRRRAPRPRRRWSSAGRLQGPTHGSRGRARTLA
jgi:cation-transporting ATPase F